MLEYLNLATTDSGIACICWGWRLNDYQLRFPLMTRFDIDRDGIWFQIAFIKPLTSYGLLDYIHDEIPF